MGSIPIRQTGHVSVWLFPGIHCSFGFLLYFTLFKAVHTFFCKLKISTALSIIGLLPMVPLKEMRLYFHDPGSGNLNWIKKNKIK